MGNSLQDQLLKAGLVSDKQVREAQRGKKKQAKQTGNKQVNPAQQQARRAREEKAARDRALAQAQADERARKERRDQLVQLLQHAALNKEEGEIAYNFTEGSRVKRIYLTPEVHKGLVAGRLFVVSCRRKHYVVDAQAAQRARALEPKAVLDPPANQDEADAQAYLDHPIPDDLMW